MRNLNEMMDEFIHGKIWKIPNLNLNVTEPIGGIEEDISKITAEMAKL